MFICNPIKTEERRKQMVTLLKSYFNVTIWSNIEKIFNITNIIVYEIDDSIGCVVGCIMLGIVMVTAGITPMFSIFGGTSLFVEFVKLLVWKWFANKRGLTSYEEVDTALRERLER